MREVFASVGMVLALACVAVPARADDPHDASMRIATARDRDRATIRRLNLEEAARVRKRDAQYAHGWRAARNHDGGDHAVRMSEYRQALASHDRQQAAYERDMIAWRRAVAACRAGDYSACDR